jgi:di/tricarboxylate transporter
MVTLVIGFKLNIGVVSMGLAAVLAILRPSEGVAALGRVSWSVVVLIAGVLTYIQVLEKAGTVEWVSSGISAVSIPLVAALLLFYMSGFVSALASSLGVIGVVIALAVPFLQSGDVNVAGFVAALAISATIVDISPFSTNGAMLLVNVDAGIRDWFYKRMLLYAGLMCLIGPGLAWFVAAVPTWIG